jgi:DNA modification methylase
MPLLKTKKATKKPVKKADKPKQLPLSKAMPNELKDLGAPVWLSVKTIREYDQNPRIDQPVEQVAESIRNLGWTNPIIVDEEYFIICGHTRFRAAKTILALDKVPVLVAKDWDEAQVKAYRLADNKLTELAKWDPTFLKIELAELEGLGVESASLGFSQEELDELANGLVEHLEADGGPAEGDPDDTPDINEATPPFTEMGDVYEIGQNRLMCGDSTSLDAVERLCEGKKVDMIFTDPPYNVDYVSPKAKNKLKIKNDKLSQNDFDQLLTDALTNAYVSAHEGAPIYVCHGESQGGAFRSALALSGFEQKQCLIWVKNHFCLSRMDYHAKHEPILYGKKPGDTHTWLGGRNKSTVLNFDKPQKSEVHPTMKPVELVEFCIKNSCEPTKTVMDLFGGSGTTMVAAQQSGRVGYLMELDPKYCDVIVKRMLQLFPRLKIRKNGQPFSTREAV